MELANIEKLLEKYFEAKTTIAEEKALQTYFSQDEVAPHLEDYKPMFDYFSVAKEEQFTRHVPLKPERKSIYKWISVAAAAVLILGVYFSQSPIGVQPDQPSYTEAELKTAEKALAMLSINLNRGVEKVEHLDNFNKGAVKVNHLDEFKTNTNRFLNKKQ
ncbi:hypothetical protein GWK08_00840 [Leptobacterium flavescens]|uniref:Uncharacterized protein n=1 Tax=Leptobacterium flavescens TaxID=472055 RepID=A0A6P0ULP8_9FLAO|nr:hypothetical protein [Leptobacterium flavescens]NER11973.1 hypothetical protein [Leptobacterium flavescens]